MVTYHKALVKSSLMVKNLSDILLFEFLSAIFLVSGIPSVLVRLSPSYRYMIGALLAVMIMYPASSFPTIHEPFKRRMEWLKVVLVSMAICIVVILPTFIFIDSRLESASHLFVHDGLVQSEIATQYVLEGKNPYRENYLNTPLALFPNKDGYNPALEHYPYLPATFLFPLPFQGFLKNILGWFDQRLVYLLCFAGILLCIPYLTQEFSKRITLLTVLGLNPLFGYFFIQGRNDVLVFFWLLITLVSLQLGSRSWSVVFFAIACSTKQFAWFFFPFYCLYLSGEGSIRERLNRIGKPLFVFLLVFGVIMLPWVIGDFQAFYADVFAFQSGMLNDSIPISGMGFSIVLMKLGILSNRYAYFPFTYLQIAICIPVMLVLMWRQEQKNSLVNALLYYSIVLGIVMFFSRAFYDNYLGYLINIVTVGLLIQDETRWKKIHSSGLSPALHGSRR